MLIPRLQTNHQILKKSLILSASVATHVANFHCTPTACEKWNNKWKFDVESEKEPSKKHIRFITRQKRADAKKALKDLLYNYGSPSQPRNKETKWSLGGHSYGEHAFDQSGSFDKKGRAKSSIGRGKSQNKRTKRKFKRESFSEDFDNDPARTFHATFGNRSYTWSFSSWKESPQNSASGFEWREHSNWNNKRASEWDNSSECESDEEAHNIGSCSDRIILGLPQTGPLKIEDVKTAFRLSALKWHPDKHQGSSQATAEEKFKLCVNAYKSLCHALSST